MDRSLKRWQVAPPAPPSYLSQFPQLHPVVVHVLYNRGIGDPGAVAHFLEEEADTANPFALQGMSAAVTRIRQALRGGERMAVYGDFDADGVTATALLVDTLQALGGGVQPYIPHRVDEGYGLNRGALNELARNGISLVITVDCGIRALDEVSHAHGLGLDVIITDHHSVGARLPRSIAVIDPKRGAGSFDELAGCGVAYRLAQALLRSHRQIPVTDREVTLQEEDLTDLVALGTVADMVPLRGANRALVRQGLVCTNAMRRPGIAALCRQAGLKPGAVDAAAIGYVLGPRLNAAGRLAHAETAYQLLATRDPAQAERLAIELDGLNLERQELTRDAQEMARQMVLEAGDEALLLFAAAPEFLPGIVGLVASRLVDEFHRPAVVVEVGEETSRGSCRSIAGFHITETLEACDDLLVRYGGHARAAGFEVANRDLEELASRLRRLAIEGLDGAELIPVLAVDAEVDLSELSWELQRQLLRLEPCGYGNPRPLLVSRDVSVRHHRAVGREGRHLKLALWDGSATWDAIAFRQGEWAGHLPAVIDVAYHLEVNEWNGQRRLQLNVQDIQPAGAGR
jgi:single-stranded-DNA-specific exonuclease